MSRKLTESQVREIHALCGECRLTALEIAKVYGVSASAVRNIRDCNDWQHLGLKPWVGLPSWRIWNMKSIKQKILDNSKLDLISGCWEWQLHRLFSGYGIFGIQSGGKKYAHRAAYEEFIGPIPDGMFVCHRCDNPSCCNPDHLFLGTPQENTNDMVKKGRHSRGSKNGAAILTESDVNQIVEMLKTESSQSEIAALFGVRQQTISRINTGVLWSHVTGIKSSSIQQEW